MRILIAISLFVYFRHKIPEDIAVLFCIVFSIGVGIAVVQDIKELRKDDKK